MTKRPLCLLALLFLVIQVILIGGFQRARDLLPSDLERYAKANTRILTQGMVYKREEKPEYEILYLKDNTVRLEQKSFREPNILVYIKRNKSNKKITIGNIIRVSGKLTFFEEPGNPGNFNQKFYYQKQSIHGSVWTEEIKVIDAKTDVIRESLAKVKSRWKQLLVATLGEYNGNSMSAILLGDKSELDPQLKELYQKSGIGHILAISGLHMSFIGVGLYNILRKAGFSFLSAGLLGILFLSAYTLMIGGGVSSIRACVMFGVRMGADITGRVYDMLTSLSLAALVILLWKPLYLFDAGFLLSFGAVLGILLVSPALKNHFLKGKEREKKSLRSSLGEGICGSLGVNLMLFPIMLYFYFEFPLYSIFLNLLVIPLMSAVLGLGIVGSVAALVLPWAGMGVLKSCGWILWLYEQACRLSLSLPGSRIVFGQPEIKWIICYYFLLAGLCLVLVRSKRGVNKGFGILLCASMVWLCMLGHGKSGELEVTMLDVGQGDGVFLRGPKGGCYLMDGGSSDVSAVGKYRLEPYLKSQGVSKLDCVFVSHGDADHMNGVEEMLKNQALGIRIDTLVLPSKKVWDDTLLNLAKTAREAGTKVAVMEDGEEIQEGSMTFSCLGPGEEFQGEPGNAASLVLSLTYRQFTMLLPGDLEGDGERMLIDGMRGVEYTVLKVAHHGSKNSTDADLLKLIRPGFAVISAGTNNLYGHPHNETLKRLEECGSEVLSTQVGGAVMFKTDGREIEVSVYKK